VFYRDVQISYNASGEGLFKPSDCRHIGEGELWPNHCATFIAAKKV